MEHTGIMADRPCHTNRQSDQQTTYENSRGTYTSNNKYEKKERIRLVEGNRKTSSREFQLSLHAEISEEVMAFS